MKEEEEARRAIKTLQKGRALESHKGRMGTQSWAVWEMCKVAVRETKTKRQMSVVLH